MKITVGMRVTGRYYCEIEVDDPTDKEAIRAAASKKYTEADFGALEESDAEAIVFEDKNGNVSRFD